MSIITHCLRSKTKKNALCDDHVRHSIRLSIGLSLVNEQRPNRLSNFHKILYTTLLQTVFQDT